eukprot:CAMPEP_0119320986 /NCGR_PEP_ID=MMETSP1333-20130426/54066_1 /TAXON_ID=418940 /ORGANISM="Scyphosphaera apsteinii, Strain RCC1455" /LENGTH=97 /DNA_ID=CAMNT_0007327835 /DNA_START=111 /DNA_END=401 /DNA_ORIENTATION=+
MLQHALAGVTVMSSLHQGRLRGYLPPHLYNAREGLASRPAESAVCYEVCYPGFEQATLASGCASESVHDIVLPRLSTRDPVRAPGRAPTHAPNKAVQ